MTELTDVLERVYEAVEKREICFKNFSALENKNVRDHCHYNSLYWGPAHNNCNLKYLIQDHIPILFHNLKGHDTHLFIKELGKKFSKDDIGAIAKNKEKYFSIIFKINTSWLV